MSPFFNVDEAEVIIIIEEINDEIIVFVFKKMLDKQLRK